jgi:integrase
MSASFDEVQRRFMEEYGPKLKERTRTEYQRLLDNVISPRFRNRQLADIERSDVSKLHARMSDVPARANFALSVMSRVFSWAEENGYELSGGNPCSKIAKYRLGKRERYLTAEEYQRLGVAIAYFEKTGELGVYTAAALRVLMLTGARLNEILTLKWSFVRLDKECLFLPDSKTGEKTIRLGDAAIEVLRGIPRVEGNPFVMVGHIHGTHLVNLHKSWDLVRIKAGLEDVRIHDLRHSFASVAADSGASLPMIGGLLGHAEPQTTARYVHLVDRHLHELNQRVDHAIGSALTAAGSRKRRIKQR